MKIVLITQRLKMDIILKKLIRPKINKKLLYQYSKSKCNKIVSIVYFGRSGSQFLYGLLESHPNFYRLNLSLEHIGQIKITVPLVQILEISSSIF